MYEFREYKMWKCKTINLINSSWHPRYYVEWLSRQLNDNGKKAVEQKKAAHLKVTDAKIEQKVVFNGKYQECKKNTKRLVKESKEEMKNNFAGNEKCFGSG